MKNRDEVIGDLEREYDLDAGFIGQLRAGIFDAEALHRLMGVLRRCPSAGARVVDSDMVRLLWWPPWIIEWQAERLRAEGKPAEHGDRARQSVFNELERILVVA